MLKFTGGHELGEEVESETGAENSGEAAEMHKSSTMPTIEIEDEDNCKEQTPSKAEEDGATLDRKKKKGRIVSMLKKKKKKKKDKDKERLNDDGLVVDDGNSEDLSFVGNGAEEDGSDEKEGVDVSTDSKKEPDSVSSPSDNKREKKQKVDRDRRRTNRIPDFPKFSNMRGTGKPSRKESSAKQPRPAQKQYATDESMEAQEDYEMSLKQRLTDNEVLAAFDKMLEDMGLTDQKAAPLKTRDMKTKRDMVVQYMKRTGAATAGQSDAQMKPGDYVMELLDLRTTNPLDTSTFQSILSSLRVSLASNTISWVQQFGEKGLDVILLILIDFNKRKGKDCVDIRHECIKCIKAFMNNKYGITTVLKHDKAIIHIASALEPQYENMTVDTAKLLAAVCFVPPNGHEKVLEALTEVGEKNERPRFAPIVEALSNDKNPQLMCVCMQLMNAITTNPDDLDFRLHLRNEFMRNGMIKNLPELRDNPSEELGVQMRVFDDHRMDDADEIQHRFEGLCVELDDLEGVFQLLQQVVANTQSENYFLSILQHLALVREDMFIRPQYYKLIEECISQIVLNKSGFDPDFGYKNKFEMDFTALIEQMAEKARYENMEGKTVKLEKELEQEITSRQETEAKLTQAKDEVEKKEKEIEQLKQQLASGSFVAGGPPAPPGAPGPPGPGVPPPPPPPPPPFQGTDIASPPPPPPPGPPPPPFGGPVPPPPPPLNGKGPPGPPPPPGGVPMFGGLGGSLSPLSSSLPHGMKAKKKWNPETPMKRANWNKIQPKQLKKNSFWVSVQEDQLEDKATMDKLAMLFASKPGKNLGGGGGQVEVDAKSEKKKTKNLKVLSAKEAQNLSIWLGSMRIPHEEIKRRLIEIDENHLNEGLIASLLKNLPEPESIKSVYALKEEFSDMNEAEQFCVMVGDIKGLQKRLEAISFKMKFQESIGDIKPDIATVTKACEELRNSKSFLKLLELVLLFGNYMNAGSRNAGSIGFDLNFLTKLRGTKSVDNKMNFLHFLADQIQEKFPDIADFPETINHTKKASRVSEDNVQKLMKKMEKDIKQLDKDLGKYKPIPDTNDQFLPIMKDFIKGAKEQFKTLDSMFDKMKKLYKELAEFYSFDTSKKSMEEFFGDIKVFLDEYQQAKVDNKKRQEAEEKAKKALEAKEKKEREKMEKRNRINLVDMNADDDGEGVIDNLLEALQSGSAFNKPEKKRRQPRAAGAERQRQLERSRSRVGKTMMLNATEIDINGTSSPSAARKQNAGGRRGGRRQNNDKDDGAALMQRLHAL